MPLACRGGPHPADRLGNGGFYNRVLSYENSVGRDASALRQAGRSLSIFRL